ncbi:GNAT family N-acetyltransferase [Virgibacillus sp. 179-BFC.A HS]|uniref:GNAT family N-acetyltransferase n=1 Tax=Tigheibacillus jepli TaxID=3035914 RepID=A0ABU5CCX6_9BACI|nr:GNAT family N-acetyltransferase [Virgibacillus sp. 179-BFC.A HS]MDY0404060.1 GNAT family N-acetyltransferase [Virgibacillus sp. 179-BFC.A HS]
MQEANVMKKLDISLKFYRPIYQQQLEGYCLPAEQLQFTAMPMEKIQQTNAHTDYFPTVILCGDRLAGFFVLHGWEGVKTYHTNKQAMLLRAFSVQTAFQGRGIAQKSLQLLPFFVQRHFPDCNEIILAVNHQNTHAQHVYQKAGFIDKGIRVMGKKESKLSCIGTWNQFYKLLRSTFFRAFSSRHRFKHRSIA